MPTADKEVLHTMPEVLTLLKQCMRDLGIYEQRYVRFTEFTHAPNQPSVFVSFAELCTDAIKRRDGNKWDKVLDLIDEPLALDYLQLRHKPAIEILTLLQDARKELAEELIRKCREKGLEPVTQHEYGRLWTERHRETGND